MALSDNAQVLLKVKGDSAGGVKALKEVETAIGHLKGAASAAASGDLSGLASSLTGLVAGAGPVGIAVGAAAGAIAAMGGIAATVTTQLFDLANQAAEYGSSIYDASVQTGLSAEALSSMKVAAAQSDVEFSKVIQSVTKFSILVGQAADGSASAETALKKFGITSKDAMNDLEGSFAKVVKKIADLPPGIQRTNLAAEAFGARGGKDMIKLIDQMDGDLPGLIAKMKELGVTIDDKAARAADQFADKMTLMGVRLEMLKVKIGTAVMPAFERFFDALDGWLTNNQESFNKWVARIGVALDNVVKGFLRVANFIKDNWDWLKYIFFGPFAPVAADAFIKRLDQQIEDQAGGPKGTEVGAMGRERGKGDTTSAPSGGGGKGGDGKAAADKARQERIKALDLEVRQTEADIKAAQKKLEDALTRREETPGSGIFREPTPGEVEASIENAIEALDEYYTKVAEAKAKIVAEKLRGADSEAERENIRKQFQLDSEEDERQHEEAKARIRQNGNARYLELVKKGNGAALDALKRSTSIELAEMKAKYDQGIISEANYISQSADLKKQLLEAEKNLLDSIINDQNVELSEREAALKRKQDINAELVVNEIETQEAIREAKKRAEENDQEIDKRTELKKRWDEYFGAIVKGAGSAGAAMQTVGGLAIEFLMNMEAALKSSIANWLLYGESVGKALKKALAAQLATMAAEAAIWALKATAFGFFYLATMQWENAANAFQAAAVFAAVAVAAGAGAKALAKGSFEQQSEKATGQNSQQGNRSVDSQGQAYSSQGDVTVDASRGGMFKPEIVISDRSGMFSQLFEAEIRNNSRVRGLIVETANG